MNFENLQNNNIKKSELQEIEAQELEKRKQDLLSDLQKGFISPVIKTREEFDFSDEFLNSSEIHKAAEQGFLKCLNWGQVENAFDIKEEFNIPKQKAYELIKQGFLNCLCQEYFYEAVEIESAFNLSKQEVHELVEQGFLNCLKDSKATLTLEIREAFNLSDEFLNSKEVKEAAEQGFLYDLGRGTTYNALKIKEEFNLSEEFLDSYEVRRAIEKVFLECLDKENIAAAIEIKEKFNLSNEFLNLSEVQKIINQIFLNVIKHGTKSDILNVKNKFNIPEDFLGSPEVQEAGKQRILDSLESGIVFNIFKVRDALNIPEEFLDSSEAQEAAEQGLLNAIERNYNMFDATRFRDELFRDKLSFSFDSPRIQKAGKQRILDLIEKGHKEDRQTAFRMKDNLNISKEFLSDAEIQEAGKQGLLNLIKDGYCDTAVEINNEFNFETTAEDLKKDIAIKDFLELLEEKIPNVYDKVSNSFNKLSYLFEFIKDPEVLIQVLKDNPFLEEAFLENNKYGIRLISKYLELDTISRENISYLYEWKQEILKQNPDISPNSLEFRKLMQGKMAGYKINPETVKAISGNNLNLDEWLNYAKEQSFILGEEDKTSLSEQLSQPLDRTLDELLPEYIDSLNNSLEDFDYELGSSKILSAEQIKLKNLIEAIELKIEEEKQGSNDERKIQGMQKGLGANKQKLERLKSVSAKEYLNNLINNLKTKKGLIYSLDDELANLEKELDNNFTKKTKVKTSQIKEKLQKEVIDFLNNFNDFRNIELRQVLLQVLKQERADSIIQETEEGLHEILNHFDTDINNIKSIFAPKQKKNKFEGKRMSLRVWDRNPDVDLYQGDYSPCCISIESGCGSSQYESAISDYLTEPAIQVVNIIDKERGIPVVAAWCWLGVDEHGKPHFIIDNIEANTDYTNKYHELLTKKLEKYIENYAKSIGFDKKDIFQGSANNDLVLGFNPVGRDFVKTGPNNRPSGYYLEAETKQV